MPRSAVVLGGGSDLARATLVGLAESRLERVLLLGPNESSLTATANELSSLGVREVAVRHFDLRNPGGHASVALQSAATLGGIDLVLVAGGVLPDADFEDLDTTTITDTVMTNFTGPAVAIAAFAAVLRDQGHGRIVVFSSVAGVRVRRANFLYGSTKAGLDGFAQGLGDALTGSGVAVTVVRPGFVATKLTAGRRPAPLAATSDEVATAILRGLERGAEVIWVPGVLRYVFAVLRHAPRSIWRRLPR